jgi:hypothetical protein
MQTETSKGMIVASTVIRVFDTRSMTGLAVYVRSADEPDALLECRGS